MMDSGAPVNVCLRLFVRRKLRPIGDRSRLGRADAKLLQVCGKRKLQLKIGTETKQYESHVAHVMKENLCVSCMCESGREIDPNKQPGLNSERCCEPLVKRHCVHCMRAQIVEVETDRDPVVQPVIDDPNDGDAPREPTEVEKEKRAVCHTPFQPGRSAFVKGKSTE